MMDCGGDGGGLEDFVDLATDITDNSPTIRGNLFSIFLFKYESRNHQNTYPCFDNLIYRIFNNNCI